MRELSIGCGNSKRKHFVLNGGSLAWSDPVFLDIDPNCKPDVLHDLNDLPLPFADSEFGEVHAYEILEHVGVQGDWRGFFALFEELHRVMAPDGVLYASVPLWSSVWAWGDPGHTRIINRGTLTFLSQQAYRSDVGRTAMTDYRHAYSADFEIEHSEELPSEERFVFALRAIK